MHGAGLLDVEREHARKLLRQSLEKRETANLEALIRLLDMPRDVVERELRRLAENGEVEVLRPVGAHGEQAANDPALCPAEAEFFRLKRSTDGDARWERALMVERTSEIRMEARLADCASVAGEDPVANALWSFGAWESPSLSVYGAILADA